MSAFPEGGAATDPIDAIWFDKDGGGPSDLALQLRPFPAELDGRIPASLGLRIRAGGSAGGGGWTLITPRAAELPDSGFLMSREQVETLHRQLGQWLGHADPSRAMSEVLLELYAAVGRRVTVQCDRESPTTDDYTITADDECAGETHCEICAVAKADAAIVEVLGRADKLSKGAAK